MTNEGTSVEASAPRALEKILAEANASGHFQISVLTSADGLVIASAPSDYASDLAAAMVGFLQRISEYAQGQLGMSAMDEATFRDSNKTLLVCRSFLAANDRLILATIAPSGSSYRRVTNESIKQLQRVLA